MTDWNSAISNGWYAGTNASNGPSGGLIMGYVENQGSTWIVQHVRGFAQALGGDIGCWRRQYRDGAWGTWVSTPETANEITAALASTSPAVTGLTVGADPSIRVTVVDSTGQLRARYDDNGLVSPVTLQNFQVTGSGQGLRIPVQLGTSGSPGGTAMEIRAEATANWASAPTDPPTSSCCCPGPEHWSRHCG